jgi:hypothetical protein
MNIPGGHGRISIVVDCTDVVRLAEFWRQIVGGEINTATASDEWVALEGIPQFEYFGFQQVPESKVVKNRTHIDVMVESLELSRDHALGIGARSIGDIVEQQIYRFQVMSDPEGNEFCFVQRTEMGGQTGS